MISKYNATIYCKDDISKIANYNLAIKDKKRVWHCHHKYGVSLTRSQLILSGMYYNRPACELVFLLPEHHEAVHKGSMTLKKIAKEYGKMSSETPKTKTKVKHNKKSKKSSKSPKKLKNTHV